MQKELAPEGAHVEVAGSPLGLARSGPSQLCGVAKLGFGAEDAAGDPEPQMLNQSVLPGVGAGAGAGADDVAGAGGALSPGAGGGAGITG